MKYVLVTGGVVSGLGKGVTASSLGVLLKSCGWRVTAIKIDPYLNIDAGTMSPFEHGEVFVLNDGGEVDLDLGNYERFLDLNLTKKNNITTGKIYNSILERERRGDYLGKTVQVVPHITDRIQDWIEEVAHVPVDGTDQVPDICVIELGGVVGDIESMPFVEALRQFQFRIGIENFCVVHVSLIPTLGAIGEQKTKPTQHSVKTLRGYGLNPNVLVVRCPKPVVKNVREKLALFCHVNVESVIDLYDVSNIWQVPVMLEKQNAHLILSKQLKLEKSINVDLNYWKTNIANAWDSLTQIVKIALIGKYTVLKDSYLSVIKALQHACLASRLKLELIWIEASDIEEETELKNFEKYEQTWEKIKSADGILIPGGFGIRGFEGKILASNYARINKIPFLGICLGMHAAIVEYARNVIGLKHANSMEFTDSNKELAIVFMPETSRTHLGGTMRLGVRKTKICTPDCITSKLYKSTHEIYERHRHRYEVNPTRIEEFESFGLRFVGKDESGQRMEIVELSQDDHPFYLCVQFHPEFKSRPIRPAPIFYGFVCSAAKILDKFITAFHSDDSLMTKSNV